MLPCFLLPRPPNTDPIHVKADLRVKADLKVGTTGSSVRGFVSSELRRFVGSAVRRFVGSRLANSRTSEPPNLRTPRTVPAFSAPFASWERRDR
jgi:hypothetical protein